MPVILPVRLSRLARQGIVVMGLVEAEWLRVRVRVVVAVREEALGAVVVEMVVVVAVEAVAVVADEEETSVLGW